MGKSNVLLTFKNVFLTVLYHSNQDGGQAGERTAPADKPPDKNFKCHPNIRFGAIVCVICEDPYHYNDFERLKNKKIMGEILAICPKHAHSKLTSNFNKDTLK